MPGYENKIVTSRLVTSLLLLQKLPEFVARDTHTNRADFCLPLSSKTAQLAATAACRKSRKERALVRPVCDKGCREAEGKLQKGAGS